MKSIVSFVVEHGETTDPVNHFIEEAQRQGQYIPDCRVLTYTVTVDLVDEILELLKPDPWQQYVKPEPINYAEGMSDTDIAQDLINMDAFSVWLEETATLPEFYNRVMAEAAAVEDFPTVRACHNHEHPDPTCDACLASNGWGR